MLVQRVAAESKSKGGVLIPEKSQSKVQVANVMAVGPGMRTEVTFCICDLFYGFTTVYKTPESYFSMVQYFLQDGKVHAPTVNVGDKVLLLEFGGTKISLEEEVSCRIVL